MAYWLMKSEPDCYSIDDLIAAGGPAMWEGCRNYTVRNFFRDAMAPGDLAFFYHSSVAPAGIVGTMEIVGDAYPDPTQFDPTSDYYDPKSPRDSPRWLLRDVLFREKLKRMITLDELRRTPGLEGAGRPPARPAPERDADNCRGVGDRQRATGYPVARWERGSLLPRYDKVDSSA